MNDNALIKKNDVSKKEEQIKLIKQTVAKDATLEEFQVFMHYCNKTGLDPLTKQIYLIGRNNKILGRKVHTIQISIDGMRLIAERSGKYSGQVGPYWCDETGEWKDVWVKKENPIAAKLGVLRRDFQEPLYAVAKFSDYYQDNNFWNKFPSLMIAKCAEALALRRSFSQDLSGLYIKEEMLEDDDIIDINDIKESNEILEYFDYDKHKEIFKDILLNELKIKPSLIKKELENIKTLLKENPIQFSKNNLYKFLSTYNWSE